MKIPGRLLANASIAATAVLFAVLLAEGYARLSGLYVDGKIPPPLRAQERLYYFRDPVLGWRGRPNAAYELIGTGVKTVVRTNSLGFRDREFARDRTPGTTRIAVLGDSFIWGYGTETAGKRFTDQLEAKLRGERFEAEVYNFGIAGWGTDQEYLAYRSIVAEYRPDVVVLSYYINDSLDNIKRIGKPYYVLRDGRLELKNVPVGGETEVEPYRPSLLGRLKLFLGRHSYTYRLARNGLKEWDGFHRLMIRLRILDDELEANPVPYVESLTRALLLETCKAVRQDGAALMILWVPDLYELRRRGLNHIMRTAAAVKDRLAKSEIGCPGLDLAPAFAAGMRESPRTLYQEYDGRHWTDEGNRFVAEQVAKSLRAHGLPPYSPGSRPLAAPRLGP